MNRKQTPRPVRALPEDTVRRIAAGEVITRPAAAVKELVENALDADARTVVVEVKAGGKNLIRVTDDGHGMSRSDIRLAVTRHATSKIDTIDDLAHVTSFGFRGEALASIAAVSRMTVETTRPDSDVGTRLEIDGGDVSEVTDGAHPPGTSVIARNLFFNLPARRSFLKSDSYELRLLLRVIGGYACAFTDVGFEVISESKQVMRLPAAGDLLTRLRELHDRSLVAGLIEVAVDNPTLSLSGVVSDPTQTRGYYDIQAVFFNNRPIRSRTVTRAVYDAFGPALGHTHPNFLLFLNTDPARLDVNVHPAKQEVRFADERFLFDFVSEAVRRSIGVVRRTDAALDDLVIQRGETSGDESTAQGFWQLHNSYILAQVTSGYVIVDQHAAHERILYEETLAKHSHVPRQGLLFPITVELTADEFAAFNEVTGDLKRMGMETRTFGPQTVAVETVPAGAYMGKDDVKEFFRELPLVRTGEAYPGDRLAMLIACKAAVKFGQRLSTPEMESLINRLFACREPYTCPHGRPVIIRMKTEELERRFGRN